MRSLSWKLAGALVLIVVVTVGLMAYLTNLGTAREFRQYVLHGNAMYAQSISITLEDYYERQGSWTGVDRVLPGMLRVTGDRLILADSGGTIIADTDGEATGRSASRLGLEGYEAVVTVNGTRVGSFYYISSSAAGMMGRGGMMGGMGMMGTQPVPASFNPEAAFLSGTGGWLWVAGLAAAAVALVVGVLLTRQILKPVRALTEGARHVSKGDLSYRVEATSRDEFGELVQTFNTMAGSLAEAELQRRRLTADVAHELRTPLTIIEGTVDGMIDGVFPADAEHLTSVKEQTALLTRLIGDLRELSLAESGQLKLDVAEGDIADVVRRKVVQMEVTAREKGVRLSLSTIENLPVVSFDRIRMEQVIANLLANAIQHTPAGGSIAVSVTGAPATEPGVVMAVRDTGEGIAPEHLPHIFERFYRASDSRARAEGGSGLGLAIVKHLVQAHGGRVWAESEAGKGSTFRVWLPAKRQ